MNQVECGKLAEKIAYDYEVLRLKDKDGSHVKIVSDRHFLGYDIESVDDIIHKKPRYIEVKAVGKTGEVFLTERERINLAALGEASWIYLVDIFSHRIARTINNPILAIERCTSIVTYKIKFQEKI